MSDDYLRLFVAIEPSATLQASLRALQAELKQLAEGRAVRFVAPQNIHLTFKFLGNTEKGLVPLLAPALERSVQNVPSFRLMARGLGCFPNMNRPNNLWVGLEGDLESAALLAHNIEIEFAKVGIPRDTRAFAPHLTLGRIKRDADPADRIAVGEWVKSKPPMDYGALDADTIHLIASDLQPNGPIYTILKQVSL